MAPSIKCFSFPMKIEEITGQRILTSTKEAEEDTLGTELYVKNIPNDAFEDELVPFLEQVGPLQTLRLMMNDRKTENRGYAYITYLRKNDATHATAMLNGKEIRKFRPIFIELSLNNCRIFIGGIPVSKTKDQVWQELIKQGVQNIVDVIMYRSYSNRAENRGFIFVEFSSHKLAAKMRCRHKDLMMFGNKVIVDWSVPQPTIPENVMSQVKILYIRNLKVTETREDLKKVVDNFLDPRHVEKLYKFKNYAFIHVSTRYLAEELLKCLTEYYKNTLIEVAFAKPPNHYTQPEYRKYRMSKTNSASSMRRTSESSSSTISHSTCNVTPKHFSPLLTVPKSCFTENWVNSQVQSNFNAIPFSSQPLGVYPNYFDINLLRTQQIFNQRLGDPFFPSMDFLSSSYPLPATTIDKKSGIGSFPNGNVSRSRNDSAMSDLTQCCSSDVLREYREMLYDALGKN